MCSKAVSIRQGGVGLLWKDGDSRFKVELVAFKNRPNVVTFQVVTGNCWYYVVGVNIPPNCDLGVDEIRAALEACHTGCTPIVLGQTGWDSLSQECGLIDVIRMCTLVHLHGLVKERVKVHGIATDANGHQCPRGKLPPRHWCDGSVTHCPPTLREEKRLSSAARRNQNRIAGVSRPGHFHLGYLQIGSILSELSQPD